MAKFAAGVVDTAGKFAAGVVVATGGAPWLVNLHEFSKGSLKVHKHEIFFLTFLQKQNPYGPKGR